MTYPEVCLRGDVYGYINFKKKLKQRISFTKIIGEHFYVAHKHQCVHIIKAVFVTKKNISKQKSRSHRWIKGYYIDSTLNNTIFIQPGKSFSYFIFVFMTQPTFYVIYDPYNSNYCFLYDRQLNISYSGCFDKRALSIIPV